MMQESEVGLKFLVNDMQQTITASPREARKKKTMLLRTRMKKETGCWLETSHGSMSILTLLFLLIIHKLLFSLA